MCIYKVYKRHSQWGAGSEGGERTSCDQNTVVSFIIMPYLLVAGLWPGVPGLSADAVLTSHEIKHSYTLLLGFIYIWFFLHFVILIESSFLYYLSQSHPFSLLSAPNPFFLFPPNHLVFIF